MDSIALASLSSPPLLFFFLGVIAVIARSDLELPPQIAKFLSLYLLLAIGFKGGVALASNTIDHTAALTLLASVALAAIIPVYVFYVLRRWFSVADAAALAATYGSVSAVTFVTAISYLDANDIAWSGYMIASMALMESPAIIVGVVMYRRYARQSQTNTTTTATQWGEVLHEACLNGSVLLIIGSMVIGWISGESGMQDVAPLIDSLFVGMLCLFLLDMGIVAAKRFRDLRESDSTAIGPVGLPTLVAFALMLALFNGAVGMLIAKSIGLPEGDALLFTILAASASYIAVPAAMRLALPQANPSVYLSMALAITFPFNLLVGIPLFHSLLGWWQ